MTSPNPSIAVSPELRQWIDAQTRAGQTAQSLHRAMMLSGWSSDTALQALVTVVGEPGRALQTSLMAQSVQAGPGPQLQDCPLMLDGGDRLVTVLLTVEHPRIVLLGNFMSDEECDQIMASATPRMARSTTVSDQPSGEEVHVARTSNGMFFERGENDVVRRIEQRISRLLNWPVEKGEGMQVLQYRVGAQYLPHYDYFDPKEPASRRALLHGGNRVGTVVMYLNDTPKGGATLFPGLALAVSPKRGNAVFFAYPQADPSSGSLHGGAQVMEGEKWIATKWLREREFV